MGSSEKIRRTGQHYAASGFSRLETLPEAVIEKLRKREFAPGEIIGDRYRLKSPLGAGAMGQVFVASNTATGVDVAVKLLKPDLIASQEFRQRFQKEAEAVGSISHQNVARFFDLVVGDPTFLVMEYVAGPTLQQVLDKETRLSYDRAVRIAIRLCWGLEAAHARGIIHRDLKPANVIVASDPEVGEQPKIIDFGLAKLAATNDPTQLTRTGQIVGTPEYMAPEQIEGKAIDARADVYALGCVLYKMVAGRSPFAGDDDVQVMYKQLHQVAPPLTAHVPDVPAKIDEVLARALAKNPADRYEDTRALAQALSRAFDRRRSGPLDSEGLAKPVPKQPPLVLVGATALAVGAVCGVLLGRLHSSAGAAAVPSIVSAPAIAQPEGHELLVVTTTPEGASVELDGKTQPEKTPTAIRGLAPGSHTIRISAPGRTTVERKLTVTHDQHASIFVDLPAPQRTVMVRSVPAGANVFIDSHLVGAAPVAITVDQDDFHELRLEKLGFATLVQPMKPDDKETEISLSMELDQRPYSEVMIDSPAEAEIWLDGVNTALETPTMGLRVTPGHHTLVLKDSSGRASKPTTIDIKPGETVRLVMNL